MDCRNAAYSNDYADAVIDFSVEGIEGDFFDTCVTPVDERFSVVHRSRMLTPDIPGNTYEYQYVPKVYGLMVDGDGVGAEPFNPTALVESGILSLQGAPLYLRGRNVLVAIIDTGINFALPQFKDELGESRIMALWDQNEGGINPPPDGFSYGSEYTKADINRALQSENPYEAVPSRDELFHGTIMAGIAAGSEVEESGFVGAAPEAELIVVKLKTCKDYLREYYRIPSEVPAYAETDLMLALKYVDSFADAFERPLVICLGVGTNLGDHNGHQFLAVYMNSLAHKKSRALVICAGDEGNKAHHFRGMMPKTDGNNGYVDVEVRVEAGNRGFYMELWGNSTDTLNVSVRSPGGEVIPPLRISEQETGEFDFVFEQTRLVIQNVLVEQVSGVQLMRFFFTAPTEGIWNFRILPVGVIHNGAFNMWLPIEDFLYSPVYFLQPNPDTTATEPDFQQGIVVAGTYSLDNGSIWPDSGRGFGRDGMVTPTIVAPGVNVSTVYGERTGSSLSAALTAGGVAQLMQWAVVEERNPLMDGVQVKNYLIRGAIRSADLEYPDVRYGYGKLNIRGILESFQNR